MIDYSSNNCILLFIFEEVHIVQDLTFYVGHEQTHLTPGKHMATICKLSRGHSLPHPFNSVQEWFHYAFASADIKGEWRNGWLNILMCQDPSIEAYFFAF